INTDKFLEDARKLTEQRMDAAKTIAEAISNRVAAEEALKEAEAEERKAYKQAERHGWTKTELNKLKPTKRRQSTQKQKPTVKTSENQPDQTDSSSTNSTSTDSPSLESGSDRNGVASDIQS